MIELTQVSVLIESGPWGEMEFLCDGDYQPSEPTILHPIDMADPGCDEGVELTLVTAIHPTTRRRMDVTDMFLASDYWTNYIGEKLLEYAHHRAESAREIYDESRRNFA